VLQDEVGDMLDRHIPPDQLKLVSKKPRAQDLEKNVYVVEKILAHRGHPGSFEYKVKWKGFSDITWEPASSFRDDSIISNYWKSQN
jgi:hypothetical protein